MKSTILAYLAAAGLAVKKSNVNDINNVIFNTVIVPGTAGLTIDDGKHYQIDAVKNTAVEFTPDAIKNGAIKALKKNKDTDGYLATAENCGLISSIELVRSDDAGTGRGDILAVAKALNLKVSDVSVATQNDIIFRKEGLSRISGLVEDAGKYYTMDTAKNTATLVDAAAMAKDAKKAILAGKPNDASRLAQAFNLVSAATLVAND